MRTITSPACHMHVLRHIPSHPQRIAPADPPSTHPRYARGADIYALDLFERRGEARQARLHRVFLRLELLGRLPGDSSQLFHDGLLSLFDARCEFRKRSLGLGLHCAVELRHGLNLRLRGCHLVCYLGCERTRGILVGLKARLRSAFSVPTTSCVRCSEVG